MSVRKSPRGKWMIDVKIERTNGEIVRVRKVSPVQTRRGAERIEREIREAVVAGTWGKPATADAPTLAEWCEQFITDHSQAKGLRPSTISEQRGAFRNYLLPAIGPDTRVDTIGHAQLLAVRRFMAAKDLAPKTINNALGVMTKALGFYYESRGLPAPHWGSVRAKVPKSPPKFWEPEQYAEIIAAAERVSPEAVAAVLVMGDCGLRAGELIGLEWTHVRSKPTLQLVIQRSYTAGHFGPPKGGRPRSVPMTRRVAAALAALPRNLRHPWVLWRDGAGHMNHSTLAWLVGRVEREAGFAGAKARGQLHKLRHTYVTRLAAAGVPARTIMELAGHTSMTTTMRYMHVISGGTSAAIETLERFDGQGHHWGTAREGETKKTS